jgi:hypothetical protein
MHDAGFVGEQRQQVRHLAEAAGCEYRGDLVFGRYADMLNNQQNFASSSADLVCHAPFGFST